tara:strand:- start:2731 stop:3129 length:399 start_codon:yes stop_codon:yes gene_type:complete
MNLSTPENLHEEGTDVFKNLSTTNDVEILTRIQSEISNIESRLDEIISMDIVNNYEIELKHIKPPILRRYSNDYTNDNTHDNTYDEIMDIRLQYLNRQITTASEKIDTKIMLLKCKKNMQELENKLEYLKGL